MSQLAQVCRERVDDQDEERLCKELLMLWAVQRFGLSLIHI